MPISPDQERELLNRYRLQTIYPSAWPHQDEDNAESEDESEGDDDPKNPVAQTQQQQQRPKSTLLSSNSVSKYRNTRQQRNIRSGTQKTAQGEDSVVQNDERDPLGQHSSVVAELRRHGLPVEEDVKLRNRFMLSSTSFSPHMFLSNVHQDASTEDLLRGLEYLSHSIDEKSASLKVLVESNFEKFVRAKATIDNVYTEMRSQGSGEIGGNGETTPKRPHSRHTSKNQSHFRNTSNSFNPNSKTANAEKKKKSALTKDSEYGVQGLKTPLLELAVKADEVWGAALGGQEKESGLRLISSTLDQYREIYRICASMDEAIRKNDFDTVVFDWSKAKRFADEARNIAALAKANEVELGEQDTVQILLTSRMWHTANEQIDTFKQETWKRLRSSHGKRPTAVTDETSQDLHMELIGVLLQIGVDENPIWQWLSSRIAYLRDRIARSFERARIEIEILRRRCGQAHRDDPKLLAKYLRSASAGDGLISSIHDFSSSQSDAPDALAFWERVSSAISALLSSSDGILGEVIEFWEAAKEFIEGKAQKGFPTAVFAAGLEHLSLEPDEVENLQAGAVELVTLIRDSVNAFFSDAPVTDLSELYSPIPVTPLSPEASRNTPTTKRSFIFDPNSVPPPSPKSGQAWEKFAFWPPNGNSLAGSHYLSQALTLIGTAAAEMANMSIIKTHRGAPDSLKNLVGTVRERCAQAVIAAWIPDAERCKYMELWIRNTDRRDLTTMPAAFIAFQERVLSGMQKIAYISEAASLAGRGGEDVVVPPSAKLLQSVRGSFVTSLYKALSGMVDNAEKPKLENGTVDDPDGITMPHRGASVEGTKESANIDFSNRVSPLVNHSCVGAHADLMLQNVRMLMTLSNLSHLRTESIPQLISQFESSFSVKLTEESKTIRDVLTQIDAKLFQSYVKPTVEKIQQLITRGISDAAWPPASGRPDNAKQYIYEVLLSLVYVHAEVSSTAAPLTGQILAYLLEQAGVALITAFRSKPRYSLPALMQATLDVEFLAQTLNNYTTDRASEVQSQIYLTLDERTDADARAKLEGELPEMRAVLKRLREGTKGQFGCFRRERRGREGKPGSGGGSSTAR